MKEIQHNYILFVTFVNGSAIFHRDFKLLEDNYIQVGNNEPTPIEDYGNYMLFKTEVTEEQAFDEFLEKLSFESSTGTPE